MRLNILPTVSSLFLALIASPYNRSKSIENQIKDAFFRFMIYPDTSFRVWLEKVLEWSIHSVADM